MFNKSEHYCKHFVYGSDYHRNYYAKTGPTRIL